MSLSRSECRKQTKCSVPLIWLLPHFKKIYWVSGRHRHHIIGLHSSCACAETKHEPQLNINMHTIQKPVCLVACSGQTHFTLEERTLLSERAARSSAGLALGSWLGLLICCLFLPKVNILHIRPLSRVRLLEAWTTHSAAFAADPKQRFGCVWKCEDITTRLTF